ncbi:MAG: 2-dehydro-3-deoxy-D-gluconate 5-dehydrogenase KduD [Desulfobacterales bacterium]|nr:2-dehydro-3-deoxy-D-gluconate 5-dehydrogenase KduD [Desulfobacterales bacterium]
MIRDAFNLQGKVAVVTGCATGLGQGMSLGLAEAGALIAGVYNKSTPTCGDEITSLGSRFVGIKADLADLAQIEKVVEATVEAYGRVDILINNAGIIRRQPALEFTRKNWDDVLDINLRALFFLCQAAAKRFVLQKSGGKIINIASMLSFQGGILVPSYTASKSGVMGLTRELACEWASENINVNGIAPGYMATENTRALQEDPVRSKDILKRIPANRWGQPDDLRGAVVFLASSASDYINGHTLAVDGGWLCR